MMLVEEARQEACDALHIDVKENRSEHIALLHSARNLEGFLQLSPVSYA